jgi:ATP-dependent helicase/nuclease subunit B
MRRERNKKDSRTSPNKFLCAFAPLREKSSVQARFLLGPAGSGKTFLCLKEIRDALCESAGGPPLILLAPKQATFQLERQLLDSERWGERSSGRSSPRRSPGLTKADPREPEAMPTIGSPGVSPHPICGYTRLNIFSFERLARFVFEKSSIVPSQPLSDEGRVMVLRALLLRHERELKLFRGSARRSGFAQELGGLFNEFRQHQLTPLKLRALAQRPGLRPELRDKLQDLVLLNDAYTDWLSGHELQDENHLLDAATDALRSELKTQNSKLKIQSLWLDGFAEMTTQEIDLLAAILPFCGRATLTFCLDPSDAQKAGNSWLSLWSAIGKTYQQCRSRIENLPDCKISIETLKRDAGKSRFAGNSALRHLESGWQRGAGVLAPAEPLAKTGPPAKTDADETSAPHSIRIVACPNVEAEATFAAREILKFVRHGNRFRDCTVLVRSLDDYHKPLARAFRRYDIPFFLDRRESVSHHPLAELTRSAVRAVAFNWRQGDWFAALKAGFLPVEEAEIDRLENEALARGWRGAKWFEPIQIADDPQLEKSLEQLRKKILPPFEKFVQQLVRSGNKPTGEQLAEALRGLWSDLDAEKTLERWSLPESGNLSLVTRHLSLHLTVWEQMNLWLENLALAFPREPLPLRDWLPILETGLSNLTVGVIPPVLDEVLVGAVDRARNPDLKLALVLGVNESVFPAAPPVSTILTETDRDELGHAVVLGPNLREQLARERYYGYIACTRAREKLIVTFARNDADGRMLNPSPFIAHLQRLFPKLEVEESSINTDWHEAEHANELIQPLVEIQMSAPRPIARGEGGRRPGEGWFELLEIPALKLLAENLRQLREPDLAECLSSAVAGKIYGATLQTSSSRIEEFAQCPFRFFVHSGLRAEERKMFELDARERGSFQHEILKVFHEQLKAEGKRWRDITPPEAREWIHAIAGKLIKNFREGLLRDTAQSEFEAWMLADSLQDFVEVLVGWMREQYEFDPVVAELEFGFRTSAPAWEIDLGGGHKLALRGRIDRIDLCRQAGGDALCVVMDYKSGGQKLDAILIEHGVQLQLLAYLAAIRSWPPEVWAGLNLPAFFSLSSFGEERAGERSPIVSKSNPLAPTLSPFGRGEGEEPKIFGAFKITPAGVFYVNLRGQYESGDTRAEVLAEAGDARKWAYRHTGRFDADALPKLDSAGAADQFNYRLNNDGSLRKGSTEALPHAEFNALLDRVEMQLREMGRAIFSGDAKVDPYRKGGETACKYCDYRAVCRIDPWTHRYRVLRAAK